MKFKEMSGDGVQATDLKRVGKAEPKVYVHKDGKTIMIPAEKKDEYMAKGYKLSSLRAEDQSDKEGFEYLLSIFRSALILAGSGINFKDISNLNK